MGRYPTTSRSLSTPAATCSSATPPGPWQRGTNENTNGLLRQYFPKGTDLSVFTPEDLQAIEDEFNDRPRAVLGYRKPHEVITELPLPSPT